MLNEEPDPQCEADDEVDLLEAELDENDPVTGDINGESLLRNYTIEDIQQPGEC